MRPAGGASIHTVGGHPGSQGLHRGEGGSSPLPRKAGQEPCVWCQAEFPPTLLESGQAERLTAFWGPCGLCVFIFIKVRSS